jgi:hypothetical protein
MRANSPLLKFYFFGSEPDERTEITRDNAAASRLGKR